MKVHCVSINCRICTPTMQKYKLIDAIKENEQAIKYAKARLKTPKYYSDEVIRTYEHSLVWRAKANEDYLSQLAQVIKDEPNWKQSEEFKNQVKVDKKFARKIMEVL